MKISKGLLLVAAMTAAVSASPTLAANIVYNGTDTTAGINIAFQVTTNGTTGVLSLDDIVESSITFSGTTASRYGAFLPLTAVNRLYFSNENGTIPLSATLTDLLFDFRNGGGLNFDFNSFTAADGTQQSFAYALAARGIGDGDAVVYDHGQLATREIDDGGSSRLEAGTFKVEPYTVQSIATADVVAAVPEPATWAMMILGFGMVGFGMRYSIRKSNVKFDAKIKQMTAGLAA